MQFDPQAGITQLTESSLRRRRGGRIGQDSLVSSLGRVLDLSAQGMRVMCRRVPRSPFEIEVAGLGHTIRVKARVAWVKRRGFFRREAGLEFVDVDPEIARQLTQLGMDNRPRTMV